MNNNTYKLIRAVWHGYPVATIKEMVKKVTNINEPLPVDSDLFPNHNAIMIRQRFYGNDSVTKYLRSIGGRSLSSIENAKLAIKELEYEASKKTLVKTKYHLLDNPTL